MIPPENSLSRWSRLKREAASKGRGAVDRDDTPACSAAPQDTKPETGLAEGLVDPEELPSIDAITVDTDIRAFLKNKVPAELTRAALRHAWISDPAIRDFVGIAESQWDFNDPAAISGFGPLRETDDVPALLAQAFGQPAELATAIAELPMVLEPAASIEIAGQIVTRDQPAPDGSNDIAPERAAIEHSVAEPEGGAPSKRRGHGGALPR
jgi:hypothetical protein